MTASPTPPTATSTSGRGVWAGAGGWSHDLSDGRVASDAQERSALQAIGEQAAAARLVVAPYLIDVAVEVKKLKRLQAWRNAAEACMMDVIAELGYDR